MNQQQLRISQLGYDFGVFQGTLGGFRKSVGTSICSNVTAMAFMVAISASLVDLLNGRAVLLLSGCATRQDSGPDLSWL